MLGVLWTQAAACDETGRHHCAGVPAAHQRVLYAGRQLEDGQQLADCGVVENDTLYILLRLLGGAKKRKKKTYTKPKKLKHKHKKIKLRVLKFFKVLHISVASLDVFAVLLFLL